MQCRAQTKARKRCRNRATEGSDRCRRHAEATVPVALASPSSQKADDAPPEQEFGPNETALLKTLEALGREEPIDAARHQMLRSLAAAVDSKPERAALWEQYREALTDLMKDVKDGDSGLAAAIEALRSAAEVGDPAD